MVLLIEELLTNWELYSDDSIIRHLLFRTVSVNIRAFYIAGSVYSGDLNTKRVQISNGGPSFGFRMVGSQPFKN
jgi:hypothetical protein